MIIQTPRSTADALWSLICAMPVPPEWRDTGWANPTADLAQRITWCSWAEVCTRFESHPNHRKITMGASQAAAAFTEAYRHDATLAVVIAHADVAIRVFEQAFQTEQTTTAVTAA